jgi:hypothetical protein
LDAVEHAGPRNSATALGAARTVEPRKGFFARFMQALKESRRHEARRVMATYAHLLADRAPPDERARKKP